MNILPNSEIRILQNIPLDSNYENTLYFNTLSEQTSYFKGKTKTGGIIPNGTYVRQSDGKIRMEQNPTFFYDCNYLMFKNTTFENKWFYAFITDVEYINNELSLISFEIDVMQTYHFNYTLKKCFVERNHSYTDRVGDNIIPESFNLDDYEVGGANSDLLGLFTENVYVVMTTYDADTKKEYVGSQAQGLPTGAIYKVFTTFDNYINYITKTNEDGKLESIISCYVAPRKLINTNALNNYDMSQIIPKYTILIPRANTKNSNIWGTGWYPKNNKLYTFPYNMLNITNQMGDELDLAYERFYSTNVNCVFDVEGTAIAPVTASLTPKNYKTSGGSGIRSIDYRLFLQGWSMLSFSSDPYSGWLAQTMVPKAKTMLHQGTIGLGLAAAGLSVPPLALAGLGISAITTIFSSLNESYKKEIEPPQYSGGNSGNHLMTANNEMGFIARNKHIALYKAQMIDDFFTRYGYSIKQLMVPNRKTRENFCYVKTNNASITGSVNSADSKKISDIYNNGVTFWTNPDNIGDYNITNRPLGEV